MITYHDRSMTGNNIHDAIWIFVGISITVAVLVLNFGQHNMINILPDGLAPWAIAAWLDGDDWSEIIGFVGMYYSYLYSFFLWPCYHFAETGMEMFRLALIWNVFFVVPIFPLVYVICRQLDDSRHALLWFLISLVATLYVGNIAYAQYTLPENLLTLTTWLAVYLAMRLCRGGNAGLLAAVPLTVCLLVGYITHQRFLGIMLAGLLLIMVLWKQHALCGRQVIAAAVVLGLGIILHRYFKLQVQEAVYLLSQQTVPLGNDYGAKLKRLEYMLTLPGFLDTMKLLTGHIFYFCTATLLVGPIGVVEVAKRAYRPSDMKNGWQRTFCIFILTAFVSTMLISAIALNNIPSRDIPGRIDHVFFGRYSEILYGIFCVYGLLKIWLGSLTRRCVLGISIFYLLVSYVTHLQLMSRLLLEDRRFQVVASPALAPLWDQHIMVWGMAALAMLGLALLLLGKYISLRLQSGRICAILISFFLLLGFNVWTGVYDAQKLIAATKADNLHIVQAMLDKYPAQEPVRILAQRSDGLFACLQFYMRENSVRLIQPGDLDASRPYAFKIGMGQDILAHHNISSIGAGGVVILSHNPEDDSWSHISLDSFHTQAQDTDQHENLGAMGCICSGPGLPLSAGKYDLQVSLELKSDEECVSVIDAVCNKGADILAKQEISSADFQENKISVYLPINLDKSVQDFEIRLYADNQTLTVKDVAIRKR